jgi:glycosyltransferase involved in cell wall biosynthesis
MRILYLITGAEKGGAQLHVLSLARAARDAGHEVHVVAGDQGWLLERASGEGISTGVLPGLKRSWNPVTVPIIVNQLRAEMSRRLPDVLHMHSSNALFGVLAAKSLGYSAPKTIATVHGLSVLNPGWKGNQAKKVAYARTMKQLWSLCGKVVFVCQSDYDYAVSNGLADKSRSVVIRNGLEGPRDFYDVREARERLGVPAQNSSLPVVGTVARLSEEKDLDLLLETARMMPHARCAFRIVGQGPEESRLNRKIRDRGLEGRVAIIRSQGDAHRIMKGFSVFLMTSRYEGLPYTLLEAAHAGVPSVTVDVGGVREIVVDGMTGIVVGKRDPALLSDAVTHLLNDSESSARIASTAKSYVDMRFSVHQMAEDTLSEYQRITQHEIA